MPRSTSPLAMKWSLRVGFVFTAVALILASTSLVAAESRAANRWNHAAAATAESRIAATNAAAAEARHPASKTIRLDELFTEDFTFVDVGEPGASPGDYGVFRDPVADPRSGRVLGTIDVQCIEAYASQCRGSISLTGRGQIVFDGITPLEVDPDEFAVTGGTREFAGVGGALIVSFPSDTFARLTLRLVYD